MKYFVLLVVLAASASAMVRRDAPAPDADFNALNAKVKEYIDSIDKDKLAKAATESLETVQASLLNFQKTINERIEQSSPELKKELDNLSTRIAKLSDDLSKQGVVGKEALTNIQEKVKSFFETTHAEVAPKLAEVKTQAEDFAKNALTQLSTVLNNLATEASKAAGN